MNSVGYRPKWWQTAAVSVVTSLLGGLGAMQPRKKQKKLYEQKLKQAPWAPPSWVFAPAWTINNFFVVNALARILSKDMPTKQKMLLLQAGIWFIFFSFNFVYFRKKSPLLAALWTKADHILAVISIWVSFRSDRKTALYYLPLAAWTSFASFVADYQALKNPDPLFRTKAFLR